MTTEEIEAIAREAVAHPNTVARRLLGLEVRGKVKQRIDEAIAKRGHLIDGNTAGAAKRRQRAA